MPGVLRIVPKGVVDATYGRVDENNDCPDFLRLINLVPAPDSPNQWLARPAWSKIGTTSFAGQNVVCFTIIGSAMYGLYSNAGFGKDIPFAYNLLSGSFITVTGIAGGGANCPTTQSAGAWTPPHAETIGKY